VLAGGFKTVRETGEGDVGGSGGGRHCWMVPMFVGRCLSGSVLLGLQVTSRRVNRDNSFGPRLVFRNVQVQIQSVGIRDFGRRNKRSKKPQADRYLAVLVL
jgi:hypothetical protein